MIIAYRERMSMGWEGETEGEEETKKRRDKETK
jgi:hypothetical protein